MNNPLKDWLIIIIRGVWFSGSDSRVSLCLLYELGKVWAPKTTWLCSEKDVGLASNALNKKLSLPVAFKCDTGATLLSMHMTSWAWQDFNVGAMTHQHRRTLWDTSGFSGTAEFHTLGMKMGRPFTSSPEWDLRTATRTGNLTFIQAAKKLKPTQKCQKPCSSSHVH